MYTILVSNDDGIEAAGLRKLVLSLATYAKVYVAAPKRQQSAKSMSISPWSRIHATETRVAGAETAFVVDGTPADCVKFGLQKLRERGIEVDYVISGINHGANMGADTHYSGTVACAFEGALHGYRSIALSVVTHEAEYFDYICGMVPDLLRLSDEVGPDVVLNVNAPNVPAGEVKGVRLTCAGGRGFDIRYVPDEEDDHYRFEGIRLDHSESPDETDLAAIRDGYASVTPLTVDKTDHRTLQRIRRLTTDKTVCVFIDYQERLVPAVRHGEEVAETAARFGRCAKALGLPVIVTQQYTQGLGPTVPVVHDALNGQYEKVEKVEFSCMSAPYFLEKMEAVTGKTIVLLGLESHICVQHTALDLLEAGYDVIVLEDCCSSRRKQDHKAAMRLLAEAGCRVTTYESFVYGLLGSSKHKQFKTISKIVTE